MKNNKKLIFLPIMLVAIFTVTACGSLSDENTVWNRTREVEISTDIAEDDASGAFTFEPGVYEATGEVRGYGGVITVIVTVDDDGRIASIEVVEHRESDGYYQRAFDGLIPMILNMQTIHLDVDEIDAISGATSSARALLSAVEAALEGAGGQESGSVGVFTPGIFEATSEINGYGGPITAVVIIDDGGFITDVEVIEHRESAGYYQRAFDGLIPIILSEQTADLDVDNIDAISGATSSARALSDAVRIALEDAR